jgi:hypothetical protein
MTHIALRKPTANRQLFNAPAMTAVNLSDDDDFPDIADIANTSRRDRERTSRSATAVVGSKKLPGDPLVSPTHDKSSPTKASTVRVRKLGNVVDSILLKRWEGLHSSGRIGENPVEPRRPARRQLRDRTPAHPRKVHGSNDETLAGEQSEAENTPTDEESEFVDDTEQGPDTSSEDSLEEIYARSAPTRFVVQPNSLMGRPRVVAGGIADASGPRYSANDAKACPLDPASRDRAQLSKKSKSTRQHIQAASIDQVDKLLQSFDL